VYAAHGVQRLGGTMVRCMLRKVFEVSEGVGCLGAWYLELEGAGSVCGGFGTVCWEVER